MFLDHKSVTSYQRWLPRSFTVLPKPALPPCSPSRYPPSPRYSGDPLRLCKNPAHTMSHASCSSMTACSPHWHFTQMHQGYQTNSSNSSNSSKPNFNFCPVKLLIKVSCGINKYKYKCSRRGKLASGIVISRVYFKRDGPGTGIIAGARGLK